MRLIGCLIMAVIGVETAGWFGLVVGVAPIVAVTVALSRERGLLQPGPDAPVSEVSGALAALLAGSILSFTLVNGGPLAVELLAADHEQAEAGLFLNGLIVARVPLFLFQAVQASLLPKLSGLAGAGRLEDFRVALRRLLVVTGAIGAFGTAAAFAVGPPVVRLLFDEEFDLGNRTVGLLAFACSLYMVAVALAQGVIALAGHRTVALAWGTGVVAFLLGVAFASDELFLRVELGLVAGSAIAAVAMAIALAARFASGATPVAGDVIEALHDLPLEP
jgi:O-antigen/teichoic acid export membrane protein